MDSSRVCSVASVPPTMVGKRGGKDAGSSFMLAVVGIAIGAMLIYVISRIMRLDARLVALDKQVQAASNSPESDSKTLEVVRQEIGKALADIESEDRENFERQPPPPQPQQRAQQPPSQPQPRVHPMHPNMMPMPMHTMHHRPAAAAAHFMPVDIRSVFGMFQPQQQHPPPQAQQQPTPRIEVLEEEVEKKDSISAAAETSAQAAPSAPETAAAPSAPAATAPETATAAAPAPAATAPETASAAKASENTGAAKDSTTKGGADDVRKQD